MDSQKPKQQQPNDQYFVGPVTDFAFIGGATFVLFAFYLAGERLGYGLDLTANAIFITAWLAWIVNFPHFIATGYLFYQNKETVQRYFITGVIVPLLLLAGLVGCYLSPDIVAIAFVKLYLIWSPYHYTGQNLGISMIYARRARMNIDRPLRQVLAAFLFVSFFAQYAATETGTGRLQFYGSRIHFFGLPSWVSEYAYYLLYALGAALLVLTLRWMRVHKRGIPFIVMVPVAVQLIWMNLGAHVFAFQAFPPLLHGGQYLFIAWALEMHARANATPAEGHANRPGGFMLFYSSRWLAVNILGGLLVFWVLPRAVAVSNSTISVEFSIAVVFAIIQIHHFIIDGVIWRLRTKEKDSPLFTNVTRILSVGRQSPAGGGQ